MARVAIYRYDHSLDSPRASSLMTDHFSFLFDSVVSSSFQRRPAETIPFLKLSAFMYSLTNITSLAVPFVLKDTLLLSPAQVGLFSALCATPSFLKPFCAMAIHPRHRPLMLMGAAAVQAAAYVGVGLVVSKGVATVPLVCGTMFAHSIASAVGMVLRDSMMIESAAALGSETDAHLLFADMSMIQRFGLLPVSYLSGYLLNYVTPAQVITGAAFCPAVMVVASGLLAVFADQEPTPSDDGNTRTSEQLKLALDKIQDKKSGLLSTVAGRSLVTSFVPSYADAMFFFYTQHLGLSPEFMGRFQFVGSVAGIVGNAISKYAVDLIDPRYVANASNLLLVPMYASILIVTSGVDLGVYGVPVGAFLLARHAVIDFLASLTALPTAVQLMKSAPKGAEGTYLALVGTLNDSSNVLNSLLSSATMTMYGVSGTDFSRLSDMIIVCLSGTAAVIPAVLFYEDDPNRPAKKEASFTRPANKDVSPTPPLVSSKIEDLDAEISPRDA